jgi:hypothetical protein
VAKLPVDAVTVRAWGVVPLAGVTASQFPADCAEAVKFTGAPADVTVRFCVLEVVPDAVLKVSVVGLTTRLLD